MKKLYFDCETTGLDPMKNDIIQIAGIIERDGVESDTFDFKIAPFDWDAIEPKALEVSGITIEDLKTFDNPIKVYCRLLSLFDLHINKYDKDDKFVVCGYNVGFDIEFLKGFFIKNQNNFLFSYLGSKKDVYAIIQYLVSMKKMIPENSKLETICKYFNIEIEGAHDAMVDTRATKQLIEKIDNILKDIKI